MSTETPPKMEAKTEKLFDDFCNVIKDRQFRRSLDALSKDVLSLCNDLFMEHGAHIRKHMGSDDPDFIISSVVGWILGMPGGYAATTDQRLKIVGQHLLLASYIAAWSAENSSRVVAVLEGRRQ